MRTDSTQPACLYRCRHQVNYGLALAATIHENIEVIVTEFFIGSLIKQAMENEKSTLVIIRTM